MKKGFLPVPRSWQGTEIARKAEWAGAYLWMQMTAAYKPVDISTGERGRTVRLLPGQLLTSVRELSEAVGMSYKAARLFWRHLDDNNLVSYPNGKKRGGPYVVQMEEPWVGLLKGDKRGATLGATVQPSESSDSAKNGGSKKPEGRNLGRNRADKGRNFVDDRGATMRDVDNRSDLSKAADKMSPPEPTFEELGAQLRDNLGQSPKEGSEEEDPPSISPPQNPRDRAWKALHKIGFLSVDLTDKTEQRNRSVLNELIQEHGADAVEAAIHGLRNLFPYDQNEDRPFSAFNIQKRWSEALAMGKRVHQSRQQRKERREKAAEQARQAAERDEEKAQQRQEKLEELQEQWQEEPPEVRQPIEKKARKALQGSASRLGDAAYSSVYESTVLTMYARHKGVELPR